MVVRDDAVDVPTPGRDPVGEIAPPRIGKRPVAEPAPSDPPVVEPDDSAPGGDTPGGNTIVQVVQPDPVAAIPASAPQPTMPLDRPAAAAPVIDTPAVAAPRSRTASRGAVSKASVDKGAPQ